MELGKSFETSQMPDLKIKLDRLLADAADCQMIGSLATDPDKRAEYRQRAEQFRTLAEQVREQITQRPRTDTEFLVAQAASCRSMAVGIDDAEMRDDLLALATELEQKAKQERGEN